MKNFNFLFFVFIYCTLSSCVDKDLESMKTLQAEQVENTVILKWNPIVSSRFKNYQIECTNETGSFEVISDLKTNEFYNQSLSSYTVNPLPNRDNITYRVSVLTTDGYFLQSNTVTVSIKKPYIFNEAILMIKPLNNKIFVLTQTSDYNFDSCYLKLFNFDNQTIEKSVLLPKVSNLTGSLYDMIYNNSEIICFINNTLYILNSTDLNIVKSIVIPNFPNYNGLHIFTDSSNQKIFMVGNTQNTIYDRVSNKIISNKAPNYNFYSYDVNNNVFYGLRSYEDIVKFTLNSDASTNIISTTPISTKTGFIAGDFYQFIPNSNYSYLLKHNVMYIYDIINDKSFSIPTSNLNSSNSSDLYQMFYKGNYFYIVTGNQISAYDINNFKFVKSFTAPSEQYIIDNNYLYYDTYGFPSKQCFIGRVKLLD